MTDRIKAAAQIRALPYPEDMTGYQQLAFERGLEAAAAIVEAIPSQVTVKPLVWHNFDAWTFWAESTSGTYRVEERNGYWRATLNLPQTDHIIYEYDTDGTTPNDFEAAQMACQFDHEARILAAIDLTPTAVDASPAPDPVSKLTEALTIIHQMQGALIWCSASADFQDGGQAREGWLKLCAPLVHMPPLCPTPDPVSKTPALDAMAMREAAMKCCDVVFDEAGVEIEAVAASVIRYAISALPLPSPADAALAEAMALPEVVALVDAAERYKDSSCEGFCGDLPHADTSYPNMHLDCGGCGLRVALAALKGTNHA